MLSGLARVEHAWPKIYPISTAASRVKTAIFLLSRHHVSPPIESIDQTYLSPCRFLLRRAAARAISASPSKACTTQPRSINTLTSSALRLRQQQWSIASFQRRFASDEASKTESAEAAAAVASENFAQTAAEAPIEENLTPAQQHVQAEPTNESATVGLSALDAAAAAPKTSSRPQRERSGTPAEPNKVLYVGNLYYEVTPEQLKRVFSRFGDVDSIKIVYDNRGLSRG